MRLAQTSLAAVIAVAAAACSGPSASSPPRPPIDWGAFDVHRSVDAGPAGPTAKERAVAESYVAALSAPDFGELASRLDPGVHFAFPGLRDARGRAAVMHAHEVLYGAFEPRSAVMTRVFRTESAQAVEWTLTGVEVRDWMGTSATRKQVAFRGLTLLWTKDDGSITDCHAYFDTAAVQAQLRVAHPSDRRGAWPHRGGHPPDPAPPGAPSTPPSSFSTTAAAPPEVYEQEVDQQAGSAEDSRTVTAARAVLDALEAKDEAAYLAAFTDDVELVTLDRPEPFHGKGELFAQFRALHKAIGQLDTTVETAWGFAPYAVVEYSISGEQLGPIGWVPVQNDRVLRLHVVDVIALQGTRIARIWRYANPGELMARAGDALTAGSRGP